MTKKKYSNLIKYVVDNNSNDDDFGDDYDNDGDDDHDDDHSNHSSVRTICYFVILVNIILLVSS